MRRFAPVAVSAAALTLLATPVFAETFTGRVVRVADGDTITVLVGQTQRRVRLRAIDAPERPGQPYSEASRRHLASLIAGQIVTVDAPSRDRYGRDLGEVRLNGVSANAAQVEAGYAWHYTHYSRSVVLAAKERLARINRRGLWADPRPIPPWEWRRRQR